MPRLLIAYDGSDSATSAIRTAAGLLPGAEAIVLHVYDQPPGPERVYRLGAIPSEPLKKSLEELARDAAEAATAVAEQGRALAADAGLSADSAVAPSRGAEWREILAEATRREADLIVCGTRGQGALGRAVLGSVSSSLVHEADRPVLIVPAGEHDVSGPVVLGYDGSEDARNAVASVARLLPGREAKVVHAWTWPVTDSIFETGLHAAPVVRGAGVVEPLKEAGKETAARIAEEGQDLAAQHGLDAASEVRESTEGTWRALVATAADVGAAVVVVGSRGLGGVKSALLGSVSTALAHRAERPTMIVRPVD